MHALAIFQKYTKNHMAIITISVLILKVVPTFMRQISLLDAYAYANVSCMRMSMFLGLLKQQLQPEI
jgi:hypothetical protein